MELFRIKRDIPFMRYALLFNVISVVTFLIAVGSLATRGLNLGVDFTGGTLMEVSYAQPADLGKIRDAVARLASATSGSNAITAGLTKNVTLATRATT